MNGMVLVYPNKARWFINFDLIESVDRDADEGITIRFQSGEVEILTQRESEAFWAAFTETIWVGCGIVHYDVDGYYVNRD